MRIMQEPNENAIAIVGMSGRFPGASNLGEFWDIISQGKESITRFSKETLEQRGVSSESINSPQYVKARGILKDIELFDANLFGIPLHEAQLTDPQHRLFLECSFEALENAGCCPEKYNGSIGVFGGTARSTYFLHHLLPNTDLMKTMGDYLIRIGNEPDFFTTKVSYKLNLKGPSLCIQTACSTSLVSICIACNHLLTYQCDMALAGGASIFSPQESGYFHQTGMIFSPDGHCKPFEASAQGTVPSNGVGVVVLKRLEDALADRNHIYAIIRGYGINNDGLEKIGYSAPSASGQAAAIESAIAMAGIDPETISFVEAHGTATFLGDPVEIKGLTKAFRQFTDKQKFCALSSVKSNMGHCMEAAGVAGFINAILALNEKQIPPLNHFKDLNPEINLDESPFYISKALEKWATENFPRRACVSSFGIGGTNAHVILEEAPAPTSASKSNKPQLLILSAKTSSALDKIASNLGNFFTNHPHLSLADVAYTLQIGRKDFEYRRALVCRNLEEAIEMLLNRENTGQLHTEEEIKLAEIGKSWVAGTPFDWSDLYKDLNHNEMPSRIVLPTYPFEKKRYWIDLPVKVAPLAKATEMQNSPSISTLETTLLSIWKTLLQIETISLNDNFFSIGGDSLLALQVIHEIEEKMNYHLTLQMFYQNPTINSILQVVKSQVNELSTLVTLRAHTNPTPLFLIHGIDGNIFSYHLLAKFITFPGPIIGIQAKSMLKKNIESIASFYIAEIQKIQPRGPYFICGFSFGGIIAFEMAKQLEQISQQIGFLGIIDAVPPQHDLLPKEDNWKRLAFLLEFLGENDIKSLDLQNLATQSLVKKINSIIGSYELPEREQRKILEITQFHLDILKYYELGSYGGDGVFFEAKNKSPFMKNISLAKAWKNHLRGHQITEKIPGSHLNLLKEPFIKYLADRLNFHLNKAVF